MRFTHTLALAAAGLMLAVTAPARADEAKQKCPVSGHEFTVTAKSPSVMVNGKKVAFCCSDCPAAFRANPEKYLTDAGSCPVAGSKAQVTPASRIVINNNLYYTCCAGCPTQLKEDPSKFVKSLPDPVTGKTFTPKSGSPREEVNGQIYLFADDTTKAAFDKNKTQYVREYK
jgi:YHS domain-containing protein